MKCLPGLIDAFPPRQPVIDLIAVATQRSAFARDWRHRYLAHRDRQFALTPEVKPLTPASRQDVQDAIDAITAVLAHVESTPYKDKLPRLATTFEHVSHLGDGEAMLRVLRDGLESRDEALRRFRDGDGEAPLLVRPLN